MTNTKTKPKTPATKTPAAKPAAKAKPKATSADASDGGGASHKARQKLVRDSFTIPKSEYLALEGLKLRAANLARPTKKSELLRAGIAVLASMNDKAFITALGRIPSLKTGRPKSQAMEPARGETPVA